MATDPYEALQDDLEAMSIANAGLLVEVAELTAIVESVRAVRLDIVALVNGIGSGAGRHDRTRAAAFLRVLRLLDEVDGL